MAKVNLLRTATNSRAKGRNKKVTLYVTLEKETLTNKKKCINCVYVSGVCLLLGRVFPHKSRIVNSPRSNHATITPVDIPSLSVGPIVWRVYSWVGPLMSFISCTASFCGHKSSLAQRKFSAQFQLPFSVLLTQVLVFLYEMRGYSEELTAVVSQVDRE